MDSFLFNSLFIMNALFYIIFRNNDIQQILMLQNYIYCYILIK